MNEDEQLIQEALAGNPQAFGSLVQKYQNRLYHAVVHMVGSSEDARDVVQESFVQAFVKLETFRGVSTFYTWLYKITINRATSLLRRRRTLISVERHREITGRDVVDSDNPPDKRLEQTERQEQIQAALASLSEEHRTILIMREIEQFDYSRIGEILDLPVGTVRSRLFRARMQLREQLKRLMD